MNITWRVTIICIVCFITFPGYGQPVNKAGFREEIGSSPDSTVKAFLQVDSTGNGTYMLQYKKDRQCDTLTFADGSAGITSCTVKTIQIDGKGLKEVVISWTIQMSHSYGGPGGGFLNTYTLNEIWDLDRRKKIFSAQSAYYNEETTVSPGNDSTAGNERTVICSYSYQFTVTANGQVVIGPVKQNSSVTYNEDTTNRIKKEKEACAWPKPDHKAGTYILKNGVFVWTKNGQTHTRR
jgi:hypothetical protein